MSQPVIDFLETLAAATGGVHSRERFIFCGFRGDPAATSGAAWRPYSWRPGDLIPIDPTRTNGYLAISTFRQAEDRTWRRRTDLFESGRLLMVDDVGTKVPESAVENAPPTAVIETSPGNFQYCYWFERPEKDPEFLKALIASFIRDRLSDADPGMAGVNRVFRLPGFVNGKPKHIRDGKPWRCRTVVFEPTRLYTPRKLAAALRVRVTPPKRLRRASRAFLRHSPAVRRANEAHDILEAQFRAWGMVRGRVHNRADWLDVRCPWEDDHSDRAQTGASLRRPAAENDYQGAFVCHHGSHKDVRGIADVWQFVGRACLYQMEKGEG